MRRRRLLGSSRRTSASSSVASRALPLAVECSGKDTPTADTVWRRCGRATWSMNSTRSPESTARSTVSRTRSLSATSSGWMVATIHSRLELASCSKPEPRRKPDDAETGDTSPSLASAFTMRCTVERGRSASTASSASDSPCGAEPRLRRIAAARAMTCTLPSTFAWEPRRSCHLLLGGCAPGPHRLSARCRSLAGHGLSSLRSLMPSSSRGCAPGPHRPRLAAARVRAWPELAPLAHAITIPPSTTSDWPFTPSAAGLAR